jgi:hypothetical protein
MQPPEGAQVDLGKAQVIDRVPKVIKELKFGVLYAVVPQALDAMVGCESIANEDSCSQNQR